MRSTLRWSKIISQAALSIGVCIALTACGGLSEKKLYKKLYKTTCKQAFSCDEAASAEAWENVSGCRDAFAVEIIDSIAYYAACDYKPRIAKDYLRAVRKLECGAPQEDIDAAAAIWGDVYLCPFEETLETFTPGTSGER